MCIRDSLLTNVSGGTEIEADLALVDEGKAGYTSYDLSLIHI